jgi:hypothetical protein
VEISDCSIRIKSTNHSCWLRHVETERNKVKTKDDGNNAQNKQITQIFPFSWIFPWFFQKALVGIKLFYFFTIFLIIFSEQGSKRCNHKNWHLQLRWDVVYRNTPRSLKSVQKLWQFFSLFSWNFFIILMKPNMAKQSIVERG